MELRGSHTLLYNYVKRLYELLVKLLDYRDSNKDHNHQLLMCTFGKST